MTHPSAEVLDDLEDDEVLALIYDWNLWAREKQQIPPITPNAWMNWLLLAGRGFGKTRTGAEFIRQFVELHRGSRIALIAPTAADARDVMVEGESGLLSVSPPWFRPKYEPSKRRITWPNGSQAFLYSAEEPERLRGPQHHAGWCDELAAWQYPQETWDMYQFGLRLGKFPRTVITTTPRPIPLVKNLIRDEDTITVVGSTYENRANLAAPFFKKVAQYEGTRLGRQELHAEIINPEESGIIQKSWINHWPANKELPTFEYIVQSYDTAFTEKTVDKKTNQNDPTACSTYGVFQVNHTSGLKKGKFNHYGVMLLNAWTDYLGYPELRKRALEDFQEISYNGRPPDLALIEDKGSGISLRQDLSSLIPIRAYNPGREDKFARLHYVSHLVCHGRLYIPTSMDDSDFIPWSLPLIEQITCYPEVEHDDLMDTFSQALRHLRDLGYLTIEEIIEPDQDYADTPTPRNPYS